MVSGNTRGGSYVVKEEGLVYEHTILDNNKSNIDDEPTTPELFLERFK